MQKNLLIFIIRLLNNMQARDFCFAFSNQSYF